MARIIRERGGKNTLKGCAGCIIDCSNAYVDADGAYVTSSLEYETIWSMGGMLGNGDLDSIARLDFLCDDIGLDTISTGVAVAVAMDAGWVVDQNLEAFGGTLDPFSAKGQVAASRDTQIHMAAVDTVGICDFAQSGLASDEGIANVYRMVAAKSGRPFGEAEWQALGLVVLRAERDFNRRAGFTSDDDHLPAMFYEEPLPPHNTVVVSPEELEKTFDF